MNSGSTQIIQNNLFILISLITPARSFFLPFKDTFTSSSDLDKFWGTIMQPTTHITAFILQFKCWSLKDKSSLGPEGKKWTSLFLFGQSACIHPSGRVLLFSSSASAHAQVWSLSPNIHNSRYQGNSGLAERSIPLP